MSGPRRRILVTGGGGFIGRAAAHRLAEAGHAVIVVDRANGSRFRGDVEFVPLDITEARRLGEIAAGVDSVVHCASVVQTKRNQPEVVWRNNHGGTRSVIDACERNGVRRLVHISSSSVVYEGRDIEGGDETLPYAAVPEAPYAGSKIAAEKEVLAFGGSGTRTQVCALRPILVFGPGDTRLAPNILKRAAAGQLTREVGSRDKLSDFTYIANLVDAIVAAESRLEPGSRLNGQAYFVTNGEPVAFYAFVEELLGRLGYPPFRGRVPYWLAYAGAATLETLAAVTGRTSGEDGVSRFAVKFLATSHYYSIDKARRDLGWTPRVALSEGIRRTAERLRAAGPA